MNLEIVKGCGFLSFAKNIGKNLSGKYNQNLLDIAEKSATDVLKKMTIQETAKATSDLIGNKISDKAINTSSKNCFRN